jgi:hypothetical protein
VSDQTAESSALEGRGIRLSPKELGLLSNELAVPEGEWHKRFSGGTGQWRDR